MNIYSVGIHSGHLLFYLTIGFILFVLPSVTETSPKIVTGYALGLFFVMTPLTSILQTFPALGEGLIALRKIHALGLSLNEQLENAGYERFVL